MIYLSQELLPKSYRSFMALLPKILEGSKLDGLFDLVSLSIHTQNSHTAAIYELLIVDFGAGYKAFRTRSALIGGKQ